MTYHLGIDLGTTYSAAATHRDGGVEMVPIGERGPTIPSVLYLGADGNMLVGEAANRHAVTDASRVAREFKRRLGDPTPVMLGGQAMTPEVLTGHLLRLICEQVGRVKGAAPQAIALTHPANWGSFKRDLLTKAAESAGLGGVTMITEPQAAAVHYASQERIDPGSVVAVYDLGGGTFDVALLRKEADGGFSLLGTPEGLERMGGIDFDEAVYAHVARSLEEVFEGLDPEDETAVAAVARLRQECTQAKEALSSDNEAVIPVLLPTMQTEVRVARADLEDMIRPSLNETITALERALRSANLSTSDISKVLLVGGSSRIPMISELLSSKLGRPVALDTHPKHAVAMGSALAAARSVGVMPADPAANAAPASSGVAAGVVAGGAVAGAAMAGAMSAPPPPPGAGGNPGAPPPPSPSTPSSPAPSAPTASYPPPGAPSAPAGPTASYPPPGAPQAPGSPGQPAGPGAPPPLGTPGAGPGAPPPPGSSDPTFDAVGNEAPPPSLGYRSASLPPPPGVSNDLPPGMKSQQEKAAADKKAKTRKRVRGATVFVVMLVAVAATVGIMMLMEGDSDSLADMEAGECFNGQPSEGITIVECEAEHHGELISVMPPPEDFGEEFDELLLQDAVEPQCQTAAEDYTGADQPTLESEGWSVWSYRPNQAMWDEGDRDIYCVVGRGEGEEHTVPAENVGEVLDELSEDEGDGEGE